MDASGATPQKFKSAVVTTQSVIDVDAKAERPNKFKSAADAAQSAIDVDALGRSAKTAVTTKSLLGGGAAAPMSEATVSAQNTCKSGGGGSQKVSLRTSLGKCFVLCLDVCYGNIGALII